MSDTDKIHDGIGDVQKESEMTAVKDNVQPQQVIHQTINKGGFLGGGWVTTALFLFAFFLVSYSLGVMTQKNTELLGGSAVSGNAAQGSGNFNVAGFKKVAADLKLDTKKFNACLDSSKYADDVKKEMDEGVALGVNGTPSFVINGVALVGAQPFSVFEDVINGKPPAVPAEATQSGGLFDGMKVTGNISMDNVRIKGDKNAPITIVEYSDFECPYCERFVSDAYKQLDEKYIKTGKVKLVFKDFPLSFHPQAPKAAEAARCAGEQGKFWEMHDKLFELQATK